MLENTVFSLADASPIQVIAFVGFAIAPRFRRLGRLPRARVAGRDLLHA